MSLKKMACTSTLEHASALTRARAVYTGSSRLELGRNPRMTYRSTRTLKSQALLVVT